MKQIGHYLAIVMHDEFKPVFGKIAIFGIRFNARLRELQVQVIAYGEYMWINVEPHSVEIYS